MLPNLFSITHNKQTNTCNELVVSIQSSSGRVMRSAIKSHHLVEMRSSPSLSIDEAHFSSIFSMDIIQKRTLKNLNAGVHLTKTRASTQFTVAWKTTRLRCFLNKTAPVLLKVELCARRKHSVLLYKTWLRCRGRSSRDKHAESTKQAHESCYRGRKVPAEVPLSYSSKQPTSVRPGKRTKGIFHQYRTLKDRRIYKWRHQPSRHSQLPNCMLWLAKTSCLKGIHSFSQIYICHCLLFLAEFSFRSHVLAASCSLVCNQ